MDKQILGEEVTDIRSRLNEIGAVVEKKFQEVETLAKITQQINRGVILDEVLDNVYESFQRLVPYDRIGFALIDHDGKSVTARWAKTRMPHVFLKKGYSALLKGSSLEVIMKTGMPRILNDLPIYLQDHPHSDPTRLIVEEGLKSSLTCPLMAMGKPIGFMFFSSAAPNTYENIHVELFQQLAGQLATIVEKSRLYDDLADLNHLKDEFLGMAAHDLRNPIGTIKMTAEMLKDGVVGAVTEKQRSFLQGIATTSDKLLSLVNELLDVSVIESGNLKLKMQPTHLGEFLQECYEANTMFAKAKSIQLNIQLEKNLPQMSIDPDRMTQVINNLLSNAIKYSHANTVITLRAQVVGDEVQIAVADQGQGIPAAELPKLFTKFGRTSVLPTGGEKSTGLGLAIVKKIVESHGGKIWADSKVGRGSVFTVALPLPQ